MDHNDAANIERLSKKVEWARLAYERAFRAALDEKRPAALAGRQRRGLRAANLWTAREAQREAACLSHITAYREHH
jgi:hypothetical protein